MISLHDQLKPPSLGLLLIQVPVIYELHKISIITFTYHIPNNMLSSCKSSETFLLLGVSIGVIWPTIETYSYSCKHEFISTTMLC